MQIQPITLRFRAIATVLGTAALLTALLPGAAHAQGFTTDDTQLRFDGTSLSPAQSTARAGFTATPSPGGGIVPIFFYRLPTLAAGTTITSATLSLNLASLTTAGGINYNVDLYGLSFRANPTITAADFYVGPLDTSGNAALLQDNFVARSTPTANTPLGRYDSTTAGSAAIANFLNAQYAAGATGGVNGSFVLFRLSSDVASSVNAGGYDFNTQDNSSTSGLRPTLTLTTAAISAAPEPSAAALLSAVLLPLAGMMARRRFRDIDGPA